MRLTDVLCLRRIVNSSHHPFQVIPKADKWLSRERINRFTAWQYASERNTVKGAYRKMNKMFIYMDMQRQDALKLEQHHALERIQTALAEHHFEYKYFRSMLEKAHILLDNVVLSQLAIYEPRSFQALVAMTKEMAIKEGIAVIPDTDNKKFEIELDNSLFGVPFPKARLFAKGASGNHLTKPRKLRPEEY